MRYTTLCGPSYKLLEVSLDVGEKVVADAGAMAWMSDTIRCETTTRGGIFSGLKRAVLAGESFFQNTYTAEAGPGQLGLAPGCAGDIVAYDMDDSELFLEKGAYLASTEDVVCDAKWQGLKGFFNEGLFALRVTGSGQLFFNAYGVIQEIDVDGEYVVDNGFAVAWEPTLQFQLTRARKIRSFVFANQIMLRYSGRGRLWVQSRSAPSLANWAYPFRRQKSKNNNAGG
jgi:uncharacterized protein (TIGR00266 family)